MPEVKFQVGQQVRVVSRGNPRKGQIGLVKRATIQGEEVVYNLDFKGRLRTGHMVCFQMELQPVD
jgi:hypothetical protein